MDGIVIRPAGAGDVALLDTALRTLSGDLGDTHRATAADLREAGFGPRPAFRALLALQGGHAVGVAVFSPLFSTTRGIPGAYVSDLWIAASARGAGLGQRLLAAVRDDARALWDAGFLRLAVHDDNARALAFYLGLGFAPPPGETSLVVAGAALDRIGEPG